MSDKNTISTTICIIRHGETDWNSSGRLQGCEDIELNENGRNQGKQVAGYLKRFHWDVIITSPLKRASETAEIISRELELHELIINDSLRERDYGKASGLLPEERHSLFPDGVFPDQESFEHLRERAIIALNAIADKYTGKRIVVVSHGAFTNSILYTISGGEFGSFKTRLKNGCINLLHHNGLIWNVVYFNKTADEL
jgi:uncharacterized phosphatase